MDTFLDNFHECPMKAVNHTDVLRLFGAALLQTRRTNIYKSEYNYMVLFIYLFSILLVCIYLYTLPVSNLE